MKKSKAAFVAAVAALCSFVAPTAQADAWKMEPLMSRVSIVQQAQDLQETDRREFLCMSLAIYQESHGQPETGMRAVGHVILNRTHSPKFDPTVCGVVWQRGQFSWTSRPVTSLIPRDAASWEQSQRIALQIINGKDSDLTHGATYFYNRVTDHPRWKRHCVRTFALGPHVFMRERV